MEDVATGYEHFLWFSALSLAPFPRLPGGQTVTFLRPPASLLSLRVPEVPIGTWRIQNLSLQDESTEEHPR